MESIPAAVHESGFLLNLSDPIFLPKVRKMGSER